MQCRLVMLGEESAYLVLLECGDVMCVGVGQPSDDHFGVFAEAICDQYLRHKGSNMDARVLPSELAPSDLVGEQNC